MDNLKEKKQCISIKFKIINKTLYLSTRIQIHSKNEHNRISQPSVSKNREVIATKSLSFRHS